MNAACVMSLISVLASIPQPCRVLLFPLSVLELSTLMPWFLWRRPINVVKSWSVRLAVTRCCWRWDGMSCSKGKVQQSHALFPSSACSM